MFHKWSVHTGTVRYADDTGNGADMTWDEFVTSHGTEKVKDLRVSAGYTAGTNLSTTLKSLELNNQSWGFGSDQAQSGQPDGSAPGEPVCAAASQPWRNPRSAPPRR